MIRAGTIADCGALAAMARKFHDELAPMFDFAPIRAAQMALGCLRSPDHLVLVLDIGKPCGAFIGEISRYPLGNSLFAREVVLWIAPEHRGRWWRPMVDQFEAWAKVRGAVAAAMSCPVATRVDVLYRRRGYLTSELTAVKAI